MLTINDFPYMVITRIEIRGEEVSVSFYHTRQERPVIRLDLFYHLYDSEEKKWVMRQTVVYNPDTAMMRELEEKIIRNTRSITDEMMHKTMAGGLPR